MTRETVRDDAVTVPPPPGSITVTSEVGSPEPLSGESVADVGADLTDSLAGPERRAFLLVHQGYGPRVIEMRDGDEVTLGRAGTSMVAIDDPRASRQHARLFREGATVLCEDLGSRNGTKVNGATLRNQRRRVVSGDAIRVGVCEVFVASAIAATPTAPSSIYQVGAGPDPLVGAEVGRGADPDDGSIGVVVGDAKMRELFALARQLAPTDTSVLVQGEAGVGKKVIAHQVHKWSARGAKPFVRVDCASLPDMRLEGALFGYEGPGGTAREIGFLEAASGGTLLLDGVGELSAAAQASLMAALESRKIVRLGGKSEVPIDVRLLGATHRDLPAEVAARRFREDLYYLIAAFTLRVPPLRERAVEIDLLSHLYVSRFAAHHDRVGAALGDDATAALAKYEWPGNVTELRAAIRDAVSVSRASAVIDVTCLPDPIRRRQSVRAGA